MKRAWICFKAHLPNTERPICIRIHRRYYIATQAKRDRATKTRRKTKEATGLGGYLGLGLFASSISFVLIVSDGVTAKMASIMPAPRPASRLRGAVNLPCSSLSMDLKWSYERNRTPALSAFPATRAPHPLYKPRTPYFVTVSRTILIGFGGCRLCQPCDDVRSHTHLFPSFCRKLCYGLCVLDGVRCESFYGTSKCTRAQREHRVHLALC